jgi:capsular exopolysaccharide synthesis family protein
MEVQILQKNNIDSTLITIKNPMSPVSESFRTLRTNIEYANVDNKIKTIIVTSSSASEGKSTIISNLAVVFAKTFKRVLIVDTDLRKPKVHRIFNLSNKTGITNLLIDYDKNIEKYVYRIKDQNNLFVLPCGTIPPNPSEMLGSKRMEMFINDVSKLFDLVLFDTPPVGIVTDAAVLASKVDATIMVISYDNVKMDFVRHAKSLLDNVDANIIGVVFNGVPTKGKGYKGEYYYSQEYYEENRNKDKNNGFSFWK